MYTKKQYIKVQQIRGEIKIPPEQTFPLKLASKADKGLPGIKRKPNSGFLIENIKEKAIKICTRHNQTDQVIRGRSLFFDKVSFKVQRMKSSIVLTLIEIAVRKM